MIQFVIQHTLAGASEGGMFWKFKEGCSYDPENFLGSVLDDT